MLWGPAQNSWATRSGPATCKQGAHDCPSCTLRPWFRLHLLGAMVPSVSPSAVPKVEQKFRQMSRLLHTAQGEQASILTLGEGNGTPLQYSCLENPMDGGARQAAVHGVAKSRTRLSDFTFTSLSLFTVMHWRRKWQPTPVFLPGESQDGGAWWAAVYGVAQSRTQLK